jgi:hypothetical protein
MKLDKRYTRRIFATIKEKEIKLWRKFHTDGFQKLPSSRCRIITAKRMSWAVHVAQV